MLPGWSDDAIMSCDLGRLQIAIAAGRQRIEAESRERYRIAGFKVEEPLDEPEDDDAFNEQVRQTMALFRKPKP